jgi:hypothetical protein
MLLAAKLDATIRAVIVLLLFSGFKEQSIARTSIPKDALWGRWSYW